MRGNPEILAAKEIARKYRADGQSYSEIARNLAAEGFKNSVGKPHRQSNIWGWFHPKNGKAPAITPTPQLRGNRPGPKAGFTRKPKIEMQTLFVETEKKETKMVMLIGTKEQLLETLKELNT